MKKIIVGNWKMNPQTLSEAKSIFSAFKRIMVNFKNTEMIICAPFVFLSELQSKNNKVKNLKIGAQDVFGQNPNIGSRPFTGEISASMLKDLGIDYVILGHSERRAMGETDEIVNQKIKTCLSAGLSPIVCVGEKERDNEGAFFEDLKNQIKNTFSGIKGNNFGKIIIAYEPVWAIGKGKDGNMKGEDIYQMTIFIRKVISEMCGKKSAFDTKIIYGGSVNSENIKDVIFEGKVAGILPGRASLDPQEIKKILEAIQ